MRKFGQEAAEDIIRCLSRDINRKLTEQEKLNIRFGFQVLFGTINNTVINHPGPIEIKDSLFINKLTSTFKQVSYFELRPGKRHRNISYHASCNRTLH